MTLHEANGRPSIRTRVLPYMNLKRGHRTTPSPPPQISTMASTSTFQRPKGRERVLLTLDVLCQVLYIAKDACGIPPAQFVFGSAVVLLTMIRVRIPSLCDDGLPTLVYSGQYDRPTGLRRAWNILWRHMSGRRPGAERETIG